MRGLLTADRWGDLAVVTLVVGETKTTFHVHEAELFAASPVFKAAFGSDFKESSERKMTLPEDDAELFNLMVEWIYHRRYDLPPRTGDKIKNGARYMESMRLYVLADKYGVTSLKNCIVKTIFDTLRDGEVAGTNLETVAYVYQNAPQNSGIRKLLADLYACNINFDWYGREESKLELQKYPEFAIDILRSFAQHTSQKDVKNSFEGEMPKAYEK